MTDRKNVERCVLSLRVARALIEQGFPVVDIATSHKLEGKVVVKFDATAELDAALDKIRAEFRREVT
ncbi:hypothetical protein [Sporosarcina aquimarina]|uniref:DUF5659 domain-containing protein n=1 Tax=Sporosarcina aquimarina TaxID=114975 RepID=A0ABU4G0F4_9BACL|nr:hypothetical protein [Sporosarcina aquimarina]MDW0110442.1 hypothetical protein [Sporosarcina aquimarina]